MKDARRVIQLRSYALAFAVALSPAFFQTSYSCARGDTFLLSLELEVSGQDQITNFSTTTRSYAVTTSSSTAVLRVVTKDPNSNATYRWFAGGTAIGPALPIGVGGGQVTVTVPDDQSQLYVNVQAPEGAFDNYIVDVERIGRTIPMYCAHAVPYYSGDWLPSEFDLGLTPLGPVVGGTSVDVEVSGHVRLPIDVVGFLPVIFSSVTEVATRVAVLAGEATVAVRSGASGSAVVLPLAPFPTTCAVDAAGNAGLGAGPFPSCDPLNDIGAPGANGLYANSDCTGLGGAPSAENPCLPFRDWAIVDGTSDACAACDAIGWGAGLICTNLGFCSTPVDPSIGLGTELATFDLGSGSEALFGFEALPLPAYSGSGANWQFAFAAAGQMVVANALECSMGDLDPDGLSVAPVPDSSLVSISIDPCLAVCGDGAQDSCEECDDGNAVDGDGCQSDCTIDYCASDPIDCTAFAECLTDGKCDRVCEPGTGCDRCPGVDATEPDGVLCNGGNGQCESAACLASTPDSWGVPQGIELSATYGDDARVAADPNGNVTVVWTQWWDGPNTGTFLWARRYTPGTGWGSAELLGDELFGEAISPQVVADSAGIATVVWTNGSWLISKRYSPGAGWGPVEIIDSAPSVTSNVRLVVDPGDDVIAVWGLGVPIWSSRYTPMDGWSARERIDPDLGSAHEPEVAVDASGNVVAVWENRTDERIWANRYTPAGGWDVGQPIDLPAGGYPLEHHIAIDPSGNATAVWASSETGGTGNEYTIWANRCSAGGTWGTAVRIDTDAARDSRFPRAAADSVGNVIVVWGQRDPVEQIWSALYTPTGAWGAPVQVHNSGSFYAGRVVFDANGVATALWDDSLGSPGGANRYTPTSGWGIAESFSAGVQVREFDTAVDASGSVIVVWEQTGTINPPYYDIWTNRFE